MSDVVLKEFSTHPKIYIWDGEGTFIDSHEICETSLALCDMRNFMLSRFFSQILTHTWAILHGLMLSS